MPQRIVTVRRPVTVLLLLLTTIGIVAVTMWLSGKSYSKVDPIPFEDLHNLRHVMSRHAVSTHILAVIVVLVLYLFLIVESLSVAKAARDRGGTFLVLSLICFFIFHILINVGMQIGLMPVTGIPLPLISYGGSATMMFFIAIGLILNVDFRKFVNV